MSHSSRLYVDVAESLFGVSNSPSTSLQYRNKHHSKVCLPSQRQSLPVIKFSEKPLPEGWGRLSLVCSRENLDGAPRTRSLISQVTTKREGRKDFPTSTPNQSSEINNISEDSTCRRESSIKQLKEDKSLVHQSEDRSEMSSTGTIRRGLKATTSKLMSATSTRRPPGLHSTFERSGSITDRGGDPSRFVEGVSFKGKLIGVLEVDEARGDRMCQEALAELKVAVRAAGDHKQRILISIAMDGIRLTDERTGDCLYHHPVHKISFIAQDLRDSRAFGYIFGSPDAGHKFFGIKTEKAASQVVIAMRDLFQVVFERKRKEIEKARAQLEEGRDGTDFKDPGFSGIFGSGGDSEIVSASLTSGARGAIADLLDLQSELTSLQRGLSEISKRTQGLQKQPSQNQSPEDQAFDPFGDSFQPGSSSSSKPVTETKPTKITRKPAIVASAPAPLAPPPVSGRSRHDSSHQKLPTGFSSSSEFAKFPVDFKNINQPSPGQNVDRYAVFSELEVPTCDSYSEEGDQSVGHRLSVSSTASIDSNKKEEFELQWSMADRCSTTSVQGSQNYDLFTELDPLGTGKIRPFIDKKDFFNDVRRANARRLLREMGDGEEALPGSPRVQPGIIPAEVSALVASSSVYSSASNQSTINSLKKTHASTLPTFSDSFSSGSRDHLDASFADFNQFATDSPKSQRSDFSGSNLDEPTASMSVALPPESFRDSPPPFSPPPPPHSTSGSSSPLPPHYSPVMRNRLLKQTTLGTFPISPKTLPRSHKFSKQNSNDSDFPPQYLYSEGSISPRPRPRSSLSKQLSSSSATLRHHPEDFQPFPMEDFHYGAAPEPPPRPAHVEPPPLPPKRVPSHIILKPPPRPPVSSSYNYINEYDSSPEHSKSPPIPIPVRKSRASQDYHSTNRKHGEPFQFPKASFSPSKETPGTFPRSYSKGSSPASKCSTPRSITRLGLGQESADLTNISLDQLATKLNIPIEHLAKMTVVELAACLAQLQLQGDPENDGYEVPHNSQSVSKSHRIRRRSGDWDSNKFECEQDELFARFDAQFPKSPEDLKDFDEISGDNETKPDSLGAPVSEDRYAVFRELTTPGKQKSVFDENFLTPQNSMEDEISEVSSGTFKANFNDSFHHQDSVELKSSLSDELDAVDSNTKDWVANERIDHECVTVFRSPDISEYENFEPNFECKFEDNFSTNNERSLTPSNSSIKSDLLTTPVERQLSLTQKSPFADDFSKVTDVSCFTKIPNEEKFVANFNVSQIDEDNLPHQHSIQKEEVSRASLTASEKSPFEDDFSDFHLKPKVEDSGFLSNPETDKYENVFDSDSEKKSNKLSPEFSKTLRKRVKKSSFDAPNADTISIDKSQSPFEDDFSQRTCKYEVLRDLDSERDPSIDGEVVSNSKRDENSPFDDASWHGSARNTPYDDIKSISSLHSAQEDFGKTESPFEGMVFPSRRISVDPDRLSRAGSDRLQKSPYSDTNRLQEASRISLGSEGSLDVRQSPFEDNFAPPVQNDKIENGDFADFENAFSEKSSIDSSTIPKDDDVSQGLTVTEDPVFPEVEESFKVSARFPKQDENVNIFRRESDPFSDDFFDGEEPMSSSDVLNKTEKEPAWRESFDNFKFHNV